MVNSWQNIRKKLLKRGCAFKTMSEMLEHLMVEVMVDTGPSISITTITNFLAFAIGFFSPTPEIKLFSIGNALAIVLDYVYQWTIFGSFMVLTGRFEKDINQESPVEKKEGFNSIGSCVRKLNSVIKYISNSILNVYCRMLTNTLVASLILVALAGYMYISIYGVLEMRAELKPEQLFIHDSDVIKVR
jgi:predicted RND superfamily exporter protein